VVSFFGPHAPIAPPPPYNRLYNPDKMPNPVRGDPRVDAMDDRIPAEAYAVKADSINDALAREIKARYYGEITYIDECIGRILDAVEARPDAANTLICFFADHGEMLGDHGGWQKENFFEAATRIPFLVSWPARLPQNARSSHLVCLTDLFGIATTAAGQPELRDGADVLGALEGRVGPRNSLLGYFGVPGTPAFKVMVRETRWKYLFLANGGREQLFDVAEDPDELSQRLGEYPEVASRLRAVAIKALAVENAERALKAGSLRQSPFKEFPRVRYQFYPREGGSTPPRPEPAKKAAQPGA